MRAREPGVQFLVLRFELPGPCAISVNPLPGPIECKPFASNGGAGAVGSCMACAVVGPASNASRCTSRPGQGTAIGVSTSMYPRDAKNERDTRARGEEVLPCARAPRPMSDVRGDAERARRVEADNGGLSDRNGYRSRPPTASTLRLNPVTFARIVRWKVR